jgi:hypothetical protein
MGNATFADDEDSGELKPARKKPMPKDFEYYQSQACAVIENARRELKEILDDARSNDVTLSHDDFSNFLSNVRTVDDELENTNKMFKVDEDQ